MVETDKAKHSIIPSADIQECIEANHAIKVAPGSPIEVICAGMGKTGTLSLFRALNILGYKCHHMAVVVADKQRAEMLYNIVKRDNEGHGVKDVNWHQVWDGFTAGLDSPFCDYFYETSVAFPDAKVILTTRDPQAWWHSCKSVMLDKMHLSRLFKFSAVWFPALRIQMKLVDEIFKRWDRRYGGSMGPHCIEARNKEVREKISPERLLEFDVKQGWEPLCKYLGKPVPDLPFPHLNDGPALAKALLMVKLMGLSIWAVFGGLLGSVSWYMYRHADHIQSILQQALIRKEL